MLPCSDWNYRSVHLSVGGASDSAHEYTLKQYLLTALTDKASLEMCKSRDMNLSKLTAWYRYQSYYIRDQQSYVRFTATKTCLRDRYFHLRFRRYQGYPQFRTSGVLLPGAVGLGH